jgi:microcin C transport system substrate-binding protein
MSEPLHSTRMQRRHQAAGLALEAVRNTIGTMLRGLVALLSVCFAAHAGDAVHGQAMHGTAKYAAGFTHFDYVNPQAPKGGSIHLSAIGTFDSLNPNILKGIPAAGIGQVFQTLTSDSSDEAFSQYGDVAISIEVADDKTWVAYQLHPLARWHDGKPVTADDIVFSFDILKSKGHPFYRAYFGSVLRAEKLAERHVKFHFANAENAELRMIMGQLPVLPKHYYENREFDKTTLDPPLGSGPYRVLEFDAGRSITYQRVNDWWAQDLPVNRGRFNVDRIRYDYYRDGTVALEAFKSGNYDFRQESNSKLWATSYTGPPFKRGDIITALIAHERPTGMQAFVFNTRRAPFDNIKLREALAYAFDFEWTNKNLFYGQYTRSASYFSNSELASTGTPSARETQILNPYRAQLPKQVFTSTYQPPSSAGKGGVRSNLRSALKILKEAGFEVRDKILLDTTTGTQLSFEILLVQPAFERVVLPFRSNLERLGAKVNVRTVDPSQYQKRIDAFEFDMVIGSFGQSLSPGNEQRDYWGSSNADIAGSRNIIGVKDKVVDALIEAVITAPDRKELIERTRALDRVLLWGHYVIPNWHIRSFRVAYWNKFSRPLVVPKYALGFDTWWIDSDKAAKLSK